MSLTFIIRKITAFCFILFKSKMKTVDVLSSDLAKKIICDENGCQHLGMI